MRDRIMKRGLNMLVLAIVLVVIAALLWNAMPRNECGHPCAVVTFGREGGFTVRCEVASTDAERAMGLMHREELDPGRGMLFVFDTPQNVSFWMKNTHIPLDIIFIDEDGIVINIADAEPEPGVDDANLTRYESSGPVKWVVEINRGLSRENGIVPGTEVSIEIK